jgi:hypothetical protein
VRLLAVVAPFCEVTSPSGRTSAGVDAWALEGGVTKNLSGLRV